MLETQICFIFHPKNWERFPAHFSDGLKLNHQPVRVLFHRRDSHTNRGSISTKIGETFRGAIFAKLARPGDAEVKLKRGLSRLPVAGAHEGL